MQLWAKAWRDYWTIQFQVSNDAYPTLFMTKRLLIMFSKRNYEKYTQDGGCCKCACSVCVDTWCMGHLIYLCYPQESFFSRAAGSGGIQRDRARNVSGTQGRDHASFHCSWSDQTPRVFI